MSSAFNDSPDRKTLELIPNGDPYGRGFTAMEYVIDNYNPRGWYYRGDIGAAPRSFWRNYARRNGYVLREWR